MMAVIAVPGLSNEAVRAAAAAPHCTLCVLGPDDLNMGGDATLSVPAGNIVVDSAAYVGGNTAISSTGNYAVGDVYLSGGSAVTPTFRQVASPGAADPFARLAEPKVPSSPPDFNSNGDQAVTVSPGAYSYLALGGQDTVTMEPGLYIVTGGLSFGGDDHVTGSGVTFFLAGQAALSFGGGDVVSLAAPTTGPYAGISVFYDRADSEGIDMGGQTVIDLSGAVYAAAGDLNVGGLSIPGIGGPVVVDGVNLGGGSVLDIGLRFVTPPTPPS
jgi:hypothetical protein